VLPGFQADSTPPPGTSISDREDFSWLPRVKNAPLRFFSLASENSSKSTAENFQVPPIGPYVTAAMDPDSVNTLEALYITHTQALVEAIRYVKMKQVDPFRSSLIPVSESNFWTSRNFDSSRSKSFKFSCPSTMGSKSRFRNVQSIPFLFTINLRK
jgi:hypothetical protein